MKQLFLLGKYVGFTSPLIETINDLVVENTPSVCVFWDSQILWMGYIKVFDISGIFPRFAREFHF